MKRFFRSLSAPTLAAALVLAVSVAYAAQGKSASLPTPDGTLQAADIAPSNLSGKVVETMNAGGYTYACLESNGTKIWVAMPQMEIKIGQQMTFPRGAEMKNFTSKKLNRTFESIYFTDGPVLPKKQDTGKSASAEAAVVLEGKVIETMNAGGYSYVLLEKTGTKTWVAVPEMEVKVGQQITFQTGMEVKNFRSKALDKTFETIYFSGGLAEAAQPSSGKGGQPQLQIPSPKESVVTPTETISVKKAAGPNAFTIKEIYAKKSLSNKTVAVRGKVVKVSEGIMGKTWLHLQDGTGDSAKGTHDLVVTTSGTAKVGDVVTAKGKIAVNKDFGFGYKYDVIMEDALIERQ